jgi:hypothetical protein
MKTFKGTIAKEPKVTEKSVFSAIKTDNASNPIQIVLFTNHRPPIIKEILSNVKIGDEITIIGKLEKNPRNNENQIIIDELYNAQYVKTKDEFDIDENDFIIGNETKYGIISKEGNPLKEKIYFTDGEHYWYEDSEIKIPCSF